MDKMKLNNQNIKLTPGEFYGIVCPDPSAVDDYNTHPSKSVETIYNIELIKYDLPERMRYIKAVSETEYEWADRDPGITHHLTSIRGLSVRYDRIVPKREVDGYYVSDPFATDETAKIAKTLPKQPAKKKTVADEPADLGLA